MGVLEGSAEVDRVAGRVKGQDKRRCRKARSDHGKYSGAEPTVEFIIDRKDNSLDNVLVVRYICSVHR